MKYLPLSKIWIGNTQDLLGMREGGMFLKYETFGVSYDVLYRPRSKRDPRPFIQVGGHEFRLRSTEIHAESIPATTKGQWGLFNAEGCWAGPMSRREAQEVRIAVLQDNPYLDSHEAEVFEICPHDKFQPKYECEGGNCL